MRILRWGSELRQLQRLLQDLNLEAETAESLRDEIVNAKGQKRAKLIKRLRVIDNFIGDWSQAEWMVLECNPRNSARSAPNGAAGWGSLCYF